MRETGVAKVRTAVGGEPGAAGAAHGTARAGRAVHPGGRAAGRGAPAADRRWPSTETSVLAEAPRTCDLVTVPARQGLEAVDILRLRAGVGPVLHDGACDTLGFLVPPGTADGWDLPGSACTQTYAREASAGGAPGADGVPAEPPVAGTDWLVPPEGACGTSTDPVVLREALGEAARTIEAVDRCR
ncbi:hypothetical protein ACH4FX_32835 [Streptomyces sp. NPDC018019]|uniref:hypothetical protein n=1 Tax=Streptomyces sp. NPDC018019 TaxID=3365030 RepID=UPI0037BC485A